MSIWTIYMKIIILINEIATHSNNNNDIGVMIIRYYANLFRTRKYYTKESFKLNK